MNRLSEFVRRHIERLSTKGEKQVAEWDKLIDEAIAQYQIIFVNHLGDRRLPCEIDSSVFVCHGMDEIQLCAYCLANNENLLGKLQWRIEKRKKDTISIQVRTKNFKMHLQT